MTEAIRGILFTREELIELFTIWRRDEIAKPDDYEYPDTPEEFGVGAADHLLKLKEERNG